MTDHEHPIRAYRRRHGLTQADLAARAGTTLHTISRLELGGDCSLAVLRRILKAAGGELSANDIVRPDIAASLAAPSASGDAA